MIGNQHLWGESWTIYRDKSVWVVGFKGKKDGASSLHYHEHMINVLYLLSGSMKLGEESMCYRKDSGTMVAREIKEWPFLRGRDIRVIDAGWKHQLTFLQDTEGIETYYALPGHEIDEHDIVRLSPGRAPTGGVPALG